MALVGLAANACAARPPGTSRRDGAGVYRVRLAYDDDLVCLGALRNGVDVVEWLLDPSGERPDVERVVAELAVVRQREV